MSAVTDRPDGIPPPVREEKRIHPAILIALTFGLAVLRLATIASSLSELHCVYPVEVQQLRLGQDNLGADPQFRGLGVFLRENYRYLPPERQFHGVLLPNNILVWALANFFGVHYFVVPLASLVWLLLGFLVWMLFTGDHFGRRAQWVLAALYYFPPKEVLERTLYLQGSHTEAQALLGLIFFLAFRPSRHGRSASGLTSALLHPYGILLLSFGTLFFLYKGVILAVPAVLAGYLVLLKNPLGWPPRKITTAAVLFAAGCVPPVLYYWHYGFFSQYLADAAYDLGPSWFTVFRAADIRPEAMTLPPMNAGLLSEPLRTHIFPVLLAAAGTVLLVMSLFKYETRRSVAACALLTYPILHCLALSFSTLTVMERYYFSLYPFIFVIIAAGFSRLGSVFAFASTAALVALTLPGTLSLVKIDRMDLYERYRGELYFENELWRVPAADVDWVNAWLDHCKDVRAPSLLFWTPKAFEDTGMGVERLDKRTMQELPRRMKYFAPTAGPRELDALGSALAFRLKKNEVEFTRVLERSFAPPSTVSAIRQGFDRADIARPESICPTGQ